MDGFIALTDYYARHAARHFGLPAKRVHQIPMGIRGEDFAAVPPRAAAEGSDAVFTIGYLARIAPEKGLGELAQAFISLRRRGRQCRVRVAGWLGGAGRPYLAQVLRALREGGVPEEAWQFVGEVDRGGKIQFLSGLDVLAVPVTWPEPKGFYVLEALAAGVPVVQPAHGSFPELMEATGGGLLHAPGDADALAAELGRLMDQPTLRRELAKQGRAAVQRLFYYRADGRGGPGPSTSASEAARNEIQDAAFLAARSGRRDRTAAAARAVGTTGPGARQYPG